MFNVRETEKIKLKWLVRLTRRSQGEEHLKRGPLRFRLRLQEKDLMFTKKIGLSPMFLRKQSNKRQSIESLNMKMCLISKMRKSQMNHQARIKTLTMNLSIQLISGRKILWRIPRTLTLMLLKVDRKSNKEP